MEETVQYMTTATAPAVNGSGVQEIKTAGGGGLPSRALRRMRREGWFEIDKDAYPGYQVRLWVNYPHWYREEIQTQDNARMQAVLDQIMLEHRLVDDAGEPLGGWPDESKPITVDDDGFMREWTALPQPGEPIAEGERTFWQLISDEQAGLILTCILMEPQELSFLAVKKRTTSRNG